jgi:hypothetical protein
MVPSSGAAQQPVHGLHIVATHRGDQAESKQLVADAAAGDRLCGRGRLVHRIDQIDGRLRAAATFFDTSLRMLAADLFDTSLRMLAADLFATSLRMLACHARASPCGGAAIRAKDTSAKTSAVNPVVVEVEGF